MSEIETKLEELRKEWRLYPDRREVIETQVKILKMAGNAKPRKAFIDTVRESPGVSNKDT